ncbi:MAG: DUF1127 domain-containing protein [Pseudomonadota bacterium]
MFDHKLDVVPATTLLRQAPKTLAARLWHAWRNHARRRSTLAKLRDLDDRMLLDVGLQREDLATLRRYHPWAEGDTKPRHFGAFMDELRERSGARGRRR